MQKRLHLLLALFILTVNAAMAQITTSGISGKITSDGENVIGATVTATHQPSGTVYRAVTNIDGRYTIQGMRPGGPYKVDISYIETSFMVSTIPVSSSRTTRSVPSPLRAEPTS